jgi:putative transposase orfB
MFRRVERHIVTKTDKNYEAIKEVCHKSKNLYNYANYILRKSFFETRKLPEEYELTKLLANSNQDDYRALPAQTAQQNNKTTIQKLEIVF